jgi:hypothetical protein
MQGEGAGESVVWIPECQAGLGPLDVGSRPLDGRLALQVVAGVGEVEAFVGKGEVGNDRAGEGDGQGGPVEE